jgi:hypothetical protein
MLNGESRDCVVNGLWNQKGFIEEFGSKQNDTDLINNETLDTLQLQVAEWLSRRESKHREIDSEFLQPVAAVNTINCSSYSVPHSGLQLDIHLVRSYKEERNYYEELMVTDVRQPVGRTLHSLSGCIPASYSYI